jgi:hypothetical protein
MHKSAEGNGEAYWQCSREKKNSMESYREKGGTLGNRGSKAPLTDSYVKV